VAAKYILAVVGAIFLVMGILRATRLGASHPQARTWLLIAAILGTVSLWLFSRG
jgi:DMSO reductase anchor subunit